MLGFLDSEKETLMVYYKEKKKLKRVVDEIRSGESPNVSISKSGAFLVSLNGKTSATVECFVTWENEKISCIAIGSNDGIDSLLANGLDENNFLAAIQAELSPIFSKQKVKLPPLYLGRPQVSRF